MKNRAAEIKSMIFFSRLKTRHQFIKLKFFFDMMGRIPRTLNPFLMIPIPLFSMQITILICMNDHILITLIHSLNWNLLLLFWRNTGEVSQRENYLNTTSIEYALIEDPVNLCMQHVISRTETLFF